MARTEKQIAAGQRRSLIAMKGKLEKMAYEWEEIYPFNASLINELADKAEQVAKEIMELDD